MDFELYQKYKKCECKIRFRQFDKKNASTVEIGVKNFIKICKCAFYNFNEHINDDTCMIKKIIKSNDIITITIEYNMYISFDIQIVLEIEKSLCNSFVDIDKTSICNYQQLQIAKMKKQINNLKQFTQNAELIVMNNKYINNNIKYLYMNNTYLTKYNFTGCVSMKIMSNKITLCRNKAFNNRNTVEQSFSKDCSRTISPVGNTVGLLAVDSKESIDNTVGLLAVDSKESIDNTVGLLAVNSKESISNASIIIHNSNIEKFNEKFSLIICRKIVIDNINYDMGYKFFPSSLEKITIKNSNNDTLKKIIGYIKFITSKKLKTVKIKNCFVSHNHDIEFISSSLYRLNVIYT
jgi:hypothetical protein